MPNQVELDLSDIPRCIACIVDMKVDPNTTLITGLNVLMPRINGLKVTNIDSTLLPIKQMLPHLKHLVLEGEQPCDIMHDVEVSCDSLLSLCTNLQSLVIGSTVQLESFTFLRHFKHLTDLIILNGMNIENFEDFCSLSKLQSLCLVSAWQMTHFRTFPNFRHLTTLIIKGGSFKSLPTVSMKCLPSIHQIVFADLSLTTSQVNLMHPSLTKFTMFNCKGPLRGMLRLQFFYSALVEINLESCANITPHFLK